MHRLRLPLGVGCQSHEDKSACRIEPVKILMGKVDKVCDNQSTLHGKKILSLSIILARYWSLSRKLAPRCFVGGDLALVMLNHLECK